MKIQKYVERKPQYTKSKNEIEPIRVSPVLALFQAPHARLYT